MTTDRRVHFRNPVTVTSGLNILSPSGAVLGVAAPAGVSRGGFSAETSRGYPRGEALRVEVRGPHKLAGLVLPFLVVWSTRAGGGWRIGGRFTEPLTDTQAERLADNG